MPLTVSPYAARSDGRFGGDVEGVGGAGGEQQIHGTFLLVGPSSGRRVLFKIAAGGIDGAQQFAAVGESLRRDVALPEPTRVRGIRSGFSTLPLM